MAGGRVVDRMVTGTIRRHRLLAIFTFGMMISISQIAGAQLGPIDVNGYVEYQYRLTAADRRPQLNSHVATLRTNASSYLWQPWIAQVNAALGITKIIADIPGALQAENSRQDGVLLTGRLQVELLRQSRFPLIAYADRQDSSIENDLSGTDILTSNYGFIQRYLSQRAGRYSVEYRRTTTESLFSSVVESTSNSESDVWLANAEKSFGANNFDYKIISKDIFRDETNQLLTTNNHTLRHRYNSGRNVFLEDTIFFSDEKIEIGDSGNERRFLQFNGVATWRPETEKPLLVIARGLLRGSESGNGNIDQQTKNMSFTGSANYQYSGNLQFGAALGASVSDSDFREETSSTFQRLRMNYRSNDHAVWSSRYRWDGSAQFGNESDRGDSTNSDSIQIYILRFNHRLSQGFDIGTGSDLEVSISQHLSNSTDSSGAESDILGHSIFATMSRQVAKTTSYIRLTATDQRLRGDERGSFQLVNLQASRNAQLSRERSWSGSLTAQYGRDNQTEPTADATDNTNTNYSADLRYRHMNLFSVLGLMFMSELRMRSLNFISDDPFDEAALEIERDRSNISWRSQLTYQIGQLDLRLEANLQEVDDNRSSVLFFGIRRSY
ncbi:MAG: hypothetical protein DRR15_06105 [Gammaproteobacteria bacterium]|nr:MAG: hypothetical protein DRR15_06105 [Gammaproteobacteria bacterium]